MRAGAEAQVRQGSIGSPRSLLTWLVAGTLVVGAGCSRRYAVSHVQVGKKVATRNGNVVTVYGWKGASPDRATDIPGSGLDLESCRTRRNGLLLDAGSFTVRTARGAVVPPGGSNFTAAGDCVRGQIFFDVPAGDEPEYAQYRIGAKVLRWNIPVSRPCRPGASTCCATGSNAGRPK